MIRTFSVTFAWSDGHVDVIKFIYAPGQTKEISADDFKSQMNSLVGTSINNWTTAQKNLVDDPITDNVYITSHGGDAILTEVTEE